jgi:trehalose-6-phosphate synthase
MLEAMLHANRIGFQTERDTRRFLQTCAYTYPKPVSTPWRKLSYHEHEIEAVPYPISVDINELEQRLAT